MVPSEYRLEVVVAGLIERLDGARRSFADADSARHGFERAASEHLDAVLAEWSDLRFAPQAERHAAFLRQEVLHTFLPRFAAAATEMTDAERRGFGLGWWAGPAGRVSLVVVALLVLWFGLIRFESLPVIWPITVLDLALPFLPDILRTMQQRRYEGSLREVVADMGRIQDQALTYVSPASLSSGNAAESPLEAARRAAQAKVHERH